MPSGARRHFGRGTSGIHPGAIVGIFIAYMQKEGHAITRATFEENLAGKIELPVFISDIPVLLPPGATFDLEGGMSRVRNEIIALLPGEPWKGNDSRARKLRRPPPTKGQRR